MSVRALVPVLVVVLLLAACGGGSPPAATGGKQSVPRLQSMADLRADFAAHAAEPQLLLLISPT